MGCCLRSHFRNQDIRSTIDHGSSGVLQHHVLYIPQNTPDLPPMLEYCRCASRHILLQIYQTLCFSFQCRSGQIFLDASPLGCAERELATVLDGGCALHINSNAANQQHAGPSLSQRSLDRVSPQVIIIPIFVVNVRNLILGSDPCKNQWTYSVVSKLRFIIQRVV